MRFLKNLLAFILVLVIIAGVGYAGYIYWMNSYNSNSQSHQSGTTSYNQSSLTIGQLKKGTTDTLPPTDPVALAQITVLMQNQEKLNSAIETLKDAMRIMTVDPYASNANTMGGNGKTNNIIIAPQERVTEKTIPSQGNNTTINIYPQNPAPSMQTPMPAMPAMPALPGSTMGNMGTSYDVTKMVQIHESLYKVSMGMALLEQLKTALVKQAQTGSVGIANKVDYFTNQFNNTIQNKTKLDQAVSDIQYAVNLSNLNPYVSADGLIYDKERMTQLHQSIGRLAEGVSSLIELQGDLTTQSVNLANQAQSYYTELNQQLTNQHVVSTEGTSTVRPGLFNNLDVISILNVLPILFIVGLVLGILGFALNLVKNSGTRKGQSETGVNQVE